MFQEFKKSKYPKELYRKEHSLAYLMPFGYPYENKEFSVKITHQEKEGEEITHFPIVFLKDGSYQTTFRFRGKDLDSSTVYELLALTERMNNTLKQLNSEWIIHINAIRKKIKKYSKKENVKNIPIKIIELEREEFFKSGHHYESEYYISFTWLTPTDRLEKAKSIFFTKTEKENIINVTEEHLKYYNQEMTKIFALLSEVLQECKILTIDEVITFYHSLISDTEIELKLPRAFYYKGKFIASGELPEKYKNLPKEEIHTEFLPILFDNYLYDSNLTNGLEPKIGKKYIKTVSLLKYPGDAVVGLLDELNRVNIEYRWCSRYIMMDKISARKEMDNFFFKWFNARESFKDTLKNSLFHIQSINQNDDAIQRTFQVKHEKMNLDQDRNTVGYYTFTVVLEGEDKNEVEKRALQVKTILTSKGFTAKAEGFNSLVSFLGTIPGNWLNVRKPLQNSMVFSSLIPLNAVWAGDAWNKHLNTPPLLYCQTVGNTPFRLNLHFGEVGHTLIIGPTGAGKSVLLAMMQAQFLAYQNAKVIAFDRGASTRVLNKAAGGVFYDLGQDNIRFQPLRGIGELPENIEKERKKLEKTKLNITEKDMEGIYHVETERAEQEKEWCHGWILGLIEEKLKITPDIEKFVWTALTNLSKFEPQYRTMSSFVSLVGGQSLEIKDALQAFHGTGPHAKYFDGDTDFLEESIYTVFEMEKVTENKNIITPLMEYLFHVIDTRMIDGVNPVLLTIDEGWAILKSKRFSDKFEEWIRTHRKKNVSDVFTTQNPDEILESEIKGVILNQCYTRIYLPNPNAKAEIQTEYYRTFGLNDTEIEILSIAVPKRQYYFKNPKGSRLFELALSPLELAYVATSGGKDQDTCKSMMHLSPKEFNEEWLNYKGFYGVDMIKRLEEIIKEEMK